MVESVIALPDAVPNRTSESAAWITTEVSDLAGLYIGIAERITELNSRAIEASIDEQRAVALEAAAECSPLGALRLQSAYALAGTAKTVAWWRHVNEIVFSAIAETVSAAESRLNSRFMALGGALDDTITGIGSSILTGDPAPAVSGVKKAAQLVDPDGKAVSPPGSR